MITENHLHCLHCGAGLVLQIVDGIERQVCPSCGWVFYRQMKVSAGTVIEQGGRLLLVQRAMPPWQGDWYLPAGYLEYDEDPRRGAERETWEETGLVVQTKDVADVMFGDQDPRGNVVTILYTAKIVGGELTTSSESAAVQWFMPEEIPHNLAGSGHDQAIRAWQRTHRRENDA
ncbi:MAG: NUDIX hydrolase [Anaerolineaceae bacterium]